MNENKKYNTSVDCIKDIHDDDAKNETTGVTLEKIDRTKRIHLLSLHLLTHYFTQYNSDCNATNNNNTKM